MLLDLNDQNWRPVEPNCQHLRFSSADGLHFSRSFSQKSTIFMVHLVYFKATELFLMHRKDEVSHIVIQVYSKDLEYLHVTTSPLMFVASECNGIDDSVESLIAKPLVYTLFMFYFLILHTAEFSHMLVCFCFNIKFQEQQLLRLCLISVVMNCHVHFSCVCVELFSL